MLSASGAQGLCDYTVSRNRDVRGPNLTRFENLGDDACMAKCEASVSCASAVSYRRRCYLKEAEAGRATYRRGFTVLACRSKGCEVVHEAPAPAPVQVIVPEAPVPPAPAFCNRPQIAQAVEATNVLRATRGLNRLTCDNSLSEQAWLWSRTLCEAAPQRRASGSSLLDHGDVRAKVDAAVGAGGWSRYAENILWNTVVADGPEGGSVAVKQWEKSPPHLENILTGSLTTVGLGWYECDIGAAYGPVYFWTQIFLTPR